MVDYNRDMTGYRHLESREINDLADGTEVIAQTLHWNAKGYPKPSVFYRAIIGHHKTVSGIMADLTAEPNFRFPDFPPWQGKIYASNSYNMTLWIKDGE